jgi:hypothetical protein
MNVRMWRSRRDGVISNGVMFPVSWYSTEWALLDPLGDTDATDQTAARQQVFGEDFR